MEGLLGLAVRGGGGGGPTGDIVVGCNQLVDVREHKLLPLAELFPVLHICLRLLYLLEQPDCETVLLRHHLVFLP